MYSFSFIFTIRAERERDHPPPQNRTPGTWGFGALRTGFEAATGPRKAFCQAFPAHLGRSGGPSETSQRPPRQHTSAPRVTDVTSRWPKRPPGRPQRGLQEHSQEGPPRQKSLIFCGFLVNFRVLLFSASRRSKTAVFWASEAAWEVPKSPHNHPKGLPGSPREPQNGTTRVQDGPQRAPWRPKMAQRHPPKHSKS